MPNELPIPPEALAHRSVEMIRVWLANNRQHVALNIGFWEERGLDELAAWGMIASDMVRHIADAHQLQYGRDPEETIRIIRKSFADEMNHPTTGRLGEFLTVKRDEAQPVSGRGPKGGSRG